MNAEVRVADGLLRAAGLESAGKIEPLRGGANNRVYAVRAGGARCLLKLYLANPADPRDRRAVEFDFARFAWERGLRDLPQPLATDAAAHASLFSFLEGAPPAVPTGADAVAQAMDFWRRLNCHRSEAERLAPASEACFSLDAHLERVETRLRRLAALGPEAGEAAAFIAGDLLPAGERVLAECRERARVGGLPSDVELPASERRLSPSDFGFHNALADADGRLRFFDFEYAGWDDPAKTVCDFFCQPKVPVPVDFFEDVAGALTADAADPGAARARIGLLLPIYRLKWCCIMLNDFLPADARRRAFASDDDPARRRRAQLHKAWKALDALLAPSAPLRN